MTLPASCCFWTSRSWAASLRPSHRITGNHHHHVKRVGWLCPRRHRRSLAHRNLRRVSLIRSALRSLPRCMLTSPGTPASASASRPCSPTAGPPIAPLQFAQACRALGLKHRFTRPYTPRTNGKAERFIQTALREWAYACSYDQLRQRFQQLQSSLHDYNLHRPKSKAIRHTGVGWLR